jgi:uncharacterized membrane-anchored protein
MKNLTLSFGLVVLHALGLFAQETTQPDSVKAVLMAFEKQLNYQTGEVNIGNDLAKIKVPAGFRFLNAEDARKVVVEYWGNPASNADNLYGLLMPDKMNVTDENTWAFIIEYDEMGYVKDDDADKINYADLLSDMQTGEKEENAERTKAGYQAVHLVGWAEQPYYDKERKVLHWAKEIDFVGDSEHTLNYNVRVLGRKGVMVLNAVGSMNHLSDIKPTINNVLSSVEFAEGNRYADFNPSVDKVAAYGIGGLVAGKVLAKAGFFAVILKFGKVIILGLLGVGAAVWRWVKSRFGQQEEAVEEDSAAA